MAGNMFNGYGYFGGAQGMNTAPIFAPMGMSSFPNVPINAGGGSGILWVQGEAGAKSYLVAPGNTVQLMDSEANRFYIKTTGLDRVPHPLRIFEYTEIFPEEVREQPKTSNLVTREEYDALKGRMEELFKKFEQLSAKGEMNHGKSLISAVRTAHKSTDDADEARLCRVSAEGTGGSEEDLI